VLKKRKKDKRDQKRGKGGFYGFQCRFDWLSLNVEKRLNMTFQTPLLQVAINVIHTPRQFRSAREKGEVDHDTRNLSLEPIKQRWRSEIRLKDHPIPTYAYEAGVNIFLNSSEFEIMTFSRRMKKKSRWLVVIREKKHFAVFLLFSFFLLIHVNTMNAEKLAKLQQQVRIGGKGKGTDTHSDGRGV
jgi:hypothetical protein